MKLSICALLLLIGQLTYSQQSIRLTGVTLDRELFKPIQGATIFNKTRGGGAVSDSVGFFSLSVQPGDTLVFRDVRYTPSTLVVPSVLKQPDYAIIQLLVQNSLMLDEVSVYSLPSEAEFRAAFLKVKPDPTMESRAIQAKKELMQTVKETYDQDKYYYEQWSDRRIYELTGQIQPNHFLDPSRWAEFIEGLGKK